ncbi:PmoA family protein [Sediminibacterium ginsengisoli]|nr:PmoA family protein [Sediminibacterium ginsengisoli]
MKSLLKQAAFIACLLPVAAAAQKQKITVTDLPAQQQVVIAVNGKPFTTLIYSDTMEKPFLYPIYAANGTTVTRGFPRNPEPGDPTDHPHHIGLWLNYENVNGLDFWNNSYNIPAAKKSQYGWIHTDRISAAESGSKGKLAYEASWTNQQRNVLLREKTSFLFSAEGEARIIDRTTTLTAVEDVSFPDIKDGFLGLRVAHELELPVKQAKEYKDDKGNITRVNETKDARVTGNYLTSAGKQGDSAWGSRGSWCMLYGKKGGDSISILIIDHPENPGYPTYWHARNYGLFAANPLGQKIFSEGREALNYKLAAGNSVTFRYRIVINAAGRSLNSAQITAYETAFKKSQ